MSFKTQGPEESCSEVENSCCNDYNRPGMAKGIQAEIKQTKPFPSLEEEVLAALLRTADHVESQIAQFLKPFELSPTQYNALRILRGAGAEGLACHEVGERMLTHDPDITRLVARLEKRSSARTASKSWSNRCRSRARS